MAPRPPFVAGQTYNTPLDSLDELAFRGWLKKNDVPFNVNADASDYDMRGYWQALQRGQPMAAPSAVNPNDNRPHFTDYYKTPLHQSFSNESQFDSPFGPPAPQWINDSQLASPGGRIVFDEKSSDISPLVRALLGK